MYASVLKFVLAYKFLKTFYRVTELFLRKHVKNGHILINKYLSIKTLQHAYLLRYNNMHLLKTIFQQRENHLYKLLHISSFI